MNCQYCGKIFRRDYNLRRHEDEYCPDRDNDGRECSPSALRDEASISSNEGMGTHASHDDNDEDTENESSSETVLTRKTIPGIH